MRAELCPVCHGTGQVPSDFYGGETTTAGYIQCRSCYGQGYVLVPEYKPYCPWPPYSYPVDNPWPTPYRYTITWTT